MMSGYRDHPGAGITTGWSFVDGVTLERQHSSHNERIRMSVDELIDELKKLSESGRGELIVKIGNATGDFALAKTVRVFDGTVYIED